MTTTHTVLYEPDPLAIEIERMQQEEGKHEFSHRGSPTGKEG